MRLVSRLIRILLALVVTVTFAASLTGAWVAWRFRASTPVLDGAFEVAGVAGPVRIIRDEHGVPHVFGATEDDVFFGLGFVHAQDRLFQMELVRRAMSGRLAEVIGARAVPLDARHRILGYPQAAEALARNANEEVKAAAAAYSAGVNAFLAQPKRRRSPEFAVLLRDVEPWTAVDTAAVAVYMADTLATGNDDEWSRARLKDTLSLEQISEFLPGYPDFAPTSLDMVDLAPGSEAPAGAAPNGGGVEGEPAPGSNNWVVSGDLTVSGKPLLANDPHLALGSPSIWYFARLALPDGDVVGGTIPGAPFVVLGRNESAAWAFTNASFDVQDMLAKPAGEWTSTSRTETIKVRFGRPVSLEVRTTELGPILDPAYFSLPGFEGQDVVLRSTVDDQDAASSNTTYGLMKARDWDAFVEAGRDFVAPMQNMVYADVTGDIGYTVPGRLPVRDAAGVWVGEHDFDDLPRVKNPASGIIATANNQITPDAFPHRIDGAFSVYRIMRIEDQLRRTRRHDAASFRDLMYDTGSEHATRLLPALSRAKPETEAGRLAQAILADWNGDMRRDRIEPLVFALLSKEMARAIYADELGDAFPNYNSSQRVFIDSVLNGALSHWCDDVATDTRETCAQTLGVAFDRAGARLQADWADVERWDEVHQARFPHPLLSGLPVFDRLYTVREPMGGDGSTVNVAHFSFRTDDFTVSHAASMRAIYDLADLDASQFIHAPGQSGHPLSPHYRDLAPMWAAGDFIEIRTDWDEEAPPPGAHLLLLAPPE